MRIRGVFSMSIVNRLKSLFKGDKEESDVNNDVSNTSDDVQVTSSKKVSVNISKGEKEVSIEKTETVTDSGDKTVDLTFKKDIKPVEDEAAEEAVEDSSEEIVEEVEVAEETEAPVEVEEVAEEAVPVIEEEEIVVIEEPQTVVEETPVVEEPVVQSKPSFSFDINNIDFSDDDEPEIPVSTFERFEMSNNVESPVFEEDDDDDDDSSSISFKNFFKKK